MKQNKWMCPECGGMGVAEGYAPLCYREPCNYNVRMVHISEVVYQRLGHNERGANECRNYHAGVPFSTRTYGPLKGR